MISVHDLIIDNNSTLGRTFILVKTAPSFEYANGVATQRRDGTKYTLAFPEREMKRLVVKIPGPQTIELENCAIMDVSIEGLQLYVYALNGRIHVGARATGIRRIE